MCDQLLWYCCTVDFIWYFVHTYVCMYVRTYVCIYVDVELCVTIFVFITEVFLVRTLQCMGLRQSSY